LTSYSQILISDRENLTLRITSTSSQGTYNGKLKQRTYIYEIHSVGKRPFEVKYNNRLCEGKKTYAKFRRSENSFYFDPVLQKLFVQIKTHTDKGTEIIIPRIA